MQWVQPNDPDRYRTPAKVRFVTGDEFLALAMQSFLDASRSILPPPGQPWIVEEVCVWAGPEDFTNALLDGLRDRLHLKALERGHMVARTDRDGTSLEEPGCRGGTPAVMGHGCPALALAVGPAPAISEGHATAHPADPLLPGQLMQELPVGGALNPADIICAEEARA